MVKMGSSGAAARPGAAQFPLGSLWDPGDSKPLRSCSWLSLGGVTTSPTPARTGSSCSQCIPRGCHSIPGQPGPCHSIPNTSREGIQLFLGGYHSIPNPGREGIQLLPGGFSEGLSLALCLEQVWHQGSPRPGPAQGLRVQKSRKSKAGPVGAVGVLPWGPAGSRAVWGLCCPTALIPGHLCESLGHRVWIWLLSPEGRDENSLQSLQRHFWHRKAGFCPCHALCGACLQCGHKAGTETWAGMEHMQLHCQQLIQELILLGATQ